MKYHKAMTNLKKTNHLVVVYLWGKTLFIVGSVELPPLFIWAEVNPVIKIQDFSIDKLALVIDSAKKVSKSRFDLAHANPDIKPWHGEELTVWNNATKSWRIWWKADGTINIDSMKPDKIYKEQMEWKTVSEKIFSPPASSKDIAREIINQLKTK